MLKKLIVNSSIFGIAPYLPRILSVILLPILTKYLTEEDYGIIGTVTAYTAAFSAFSTLGLTQVLFNSYYHYPNQYKWLWKQLYGFLQIWVFIFGVIQATILYFILPEETETNRWGIILLSSFTLLFTATALLGNTYYQLKQTPLPIAIRTIISGFITISINYYLVVHQNMGYMGYFWASCIGTVVINISYIPLLYKILKYTPIYKFKKKTLKKSLYFSLPLIPHRYSAYLLTTSNRLVMDRCNTPINIIGEFNIAQQFSNLMDSLCGAINQAINPMTLNELKNKNSEKTKKLIYIFYLITISTTFLLSLWLKEVFSILISNDKLKEAYPYAIIMIMALNTKPMYVASSNIFFYYESSKNLLKITLTTGIISLLGYIIFIPLFDIWGAVWVYYISMIYMGHSGFYFNLYKRKTIFNFPHLKFLLLSISSTFFVYYASEINNFITKILISLVFLLIVMFYIYRTKIYKI